MKKVIKRIAEDSKVNMLNRYLECVAVNKMKDDGMSIEEIARLYMDASGKQWSLETEQRLFRRYRARVKKNIEYMESDR